MKTYLKMWAETNAKNNGMGVFGWAFSVVVWTTCVVTFLTGVTDVPEWIANIATGMRWMLVVAISTFLFLVTLYLPIKYAMFSHFKDSALRNDPESRKAYESNKHLIARDLNFEFGTRQGFDLVKTLIKAVLLFGGGSIFVGVVVLVSIAFSFFVSYFEREVTKSMMEDVIVPEKVEWLESKEACVN